MITLRRLACTYLPYDFISSDLCALLGISDLNLVSTETVQMNCCHIFESSICTHFTV